MGSTEIISLLGIIIGIVLFIFLSFKSFQLVITACLVSLVIIFTSGLPVMDMITDTWSNAFVGFLKSYFLILALSALIGKLMNDSGAARCIAKSLYRVCKKSNHNQKFIAALFVPLMYVILCYAGISGLVIVFTVLGIGGQIMKEFDIPWRFYCYGGASCVVAQWMPGSLNLTSIIAAETTETNPVGHLGFSLVATITYLFVMAVFLYVDLKRAERKGEGFMSSGAAYVATAKPVSLEGDASTPSLLVSVTPLLVSIVLAAGFNINIMISLFIGVLIAVVLFWPHIPDMKKTLGDGVVSSFSPVIGVGATSAVATVITASPGFSIIVGGLTSLPAVWEGVGYVALFTFIMSSPTGSLNSVGVNAFECFTRAGFSPELSSRMMALSTFTTCPPHSPSIANATTVAKLEYKSVIFIYLKVTLVGGTCAMALCMLLVKVGAFV